MSGIEVVGIVLAVLPLVISGLEHYADGVRTIGSIFSGPHEFKKLKRRMEMEQKTLKNTVALLLQGRLPDQVIADVIKGNSQAKSAQEIDSVLQEKLDRESYDLFLATIESMRESMMNFKRRLRLDDNGRGPFNEKDELSFAEACRRFRFGLKLKHYEDLLNEIKNDNDRLASLVQQSSSLQAVVSASSSPNFEETRKYATSVFTTLQDGFRHKSCPARHFASLRLRMNTGRGSCHFDKRVESYPEQSLSFRVILHHDTTQNTSTPVWSLVETEIRLLQSVATPQVPASHNSQPGTSTTVTARRVRFGVQIQSAVKPQSAAQAEVATSTAQTISTTTTSTDSSSGLAEIQDLCGAIPRLTKAKCGLCLGYLKHGFERHGLYWPEKQLFAQPPISTVSLTDLLQQNTAITRLSLACCFDLAADLAQSLLWLHHTPWLKDDLCGGRITFFKSNNHIHTNYPFVDVLLQQSPTTQAVTASNSVMPPNPLIKNPELLALAILLIELALRKPFSDLIGQEDLAEDGSRYLWGDFSAAMRLLGRVSEEAGARYERATRRCAEYALDPSVKLLDEKSREKIYKEVSGVLAGEARRFHSTGSDLDAVV